MVLLDQDLACVGMKEELANMTKCQVGQVLSSGDVEKVKGSCPYLRVIQARWVTAFKSVDRVRARVVAKDIRSKESARALGCSSPTLSCEVRPDLIIDSCNKRLANQGIRRKSCVYAFAVTWWNSCGTQNA